MRFGVSIIAFYAFTSFFAEMGWLTFLWDPLVSDFNLEAFPSGPSAGHPFGTDDRGRDVLSRLIYGIKYSFGFSVLVWFFSYGLGIMLGALMGYLGGWIDLIGQRVVEVLETVPYLFVVMLVIAGLGRSLTTLVIVNILMGWMMISVFVRGQVLKEKQGPSVEAVVALGASPMRVLFHHILPKSIFPVLIFSPLALASYVATLVQLDFLGIGLQPPEPSWGEMLYQAHLFFPEAWWLLVFPMLFVVGVLLSFQAIAESLKNH